MTDANQQSNRQLQEETEAISLKGSVFTATVLHLHTADLVSIGAQLAAKIEQAPQFFQNAPMVVDVQKLSAAQQQQLDFGKLYEQLRIYSVVPAGVKHLNASLQAQAVTAGFSILNNNALLAEEDLFQSSSKHSASDQEKNRTEKQGSQDQKNQGKHSDQSRAAEQAPAEAMAGIAEQNQPNTRYIRQPVRSGQQIYARNGSLVILAPVSPGAEVLADGDIHAYAPVRGRMLAGIRGNPEARIFTSKLDAELVAVDGNYQLRDDIPAQLHGQSVQIFIDEGKLKIDAL